MIGDLRSLGAHVPPVLAVGDRELVLGHLGNSLASELRSEPDPQVREALLESAFRAISDLHCRDGHASQAFARNLTWDGERVGFIDLEQNPTEVMSLHAAQARDWLFFVHSTARFMRDRPDRYRRLLVDYVARESEQVRAEIANVVRVLAPFAMFATMMGHRARDVALALRMLRHLL